MRIVLLNSGYVKSLLSPLWIMYLLLNCLFIFATVSLEMAFHFFPIYRYISLSFSVFVGGFVLWLPVYIFFLSVSNPVYLLY